MKKYLTLIAAATLMAACSNEADQTEKQAEGLPIAVTVDEGSFTRAPGEVWKASQLAEKGFGLFASYTGQMLYENTSVSPDFMYNQKVVGEPGGDSDGYSWVYNPVKYWPNPLSPEDNNTYDQYVTFFAYAPYEENPVDDGKHTIIAMSDRYDMGDPWINFRLPTDPWGEGGQTDLMYGVKHIKYNSEGGIADDLFYNETRPTYYSRLNFFFRHALACIGDKITIRLSDELDEYIHGNAASTTGYAEYADIIFRGLTINYENLTTKARLVLNSPSGPNWKEIISGELTTSRSIHFSPFEQELSAEPFVISEGQGLFYIPMKVKGTDYPYADISITYTVVNNNGTTYNGTASTRLYLDLNLEGEKEGIALILGKDLDLLHLTYPIDGTKRATEPSYSRELK